MHIIFSKIVYCKEHTDLRKKSLNMYLSTWTLLEISCLVSFFYPFLRKFFESKRDKWSRGSLHSLCIKCRSLQKVVRFLWIKKQERIIDFKANISQENRVLCHVLRQFAIVLLYNTVHLKQNI